MLRPPTKWLAIPAPLAVVAVLVFTAGADPQGASAGCAEQEALRIVIATCPPYHAKADGVTDDIAALQGIVDAQVGRAPDAKPEIVLPCGTYVISRPLRLKTDRLRLRGASDECTVIRAHPAYAYGPLLVAYGASTYATVAAHVSGPLAAGPGGALRLSSARWLNLRDAPTLNLNGLGAFSVEFFYRQATAVADSYVVSSSGARFHADPAAGSAFAIGTWGGPRFRARLQLSGGTREVQGVTTPVNGTTYHVAMTYDGRMLRLFVDGRLEASAAAGGTLVQRAWEDVVVGPLVYQWPEGTIAHFAADADVDSLRVSNVARYTTTFARPTAKLAADASTLMLLNFDEQYDVFTVGRTKDGPAHLMYRDTSAANVGGAYGMQIRRLLLAGGPHPGAILTYCNNAQVENLRVTSSTFGVLMWQNCFLSKWTRPFIQIGGTGNAAGRFAIANSVQGGVWQLDFPFLGGGAVQLYAGTASATLVHPWFQSEANTQTNFLGSGADDGVVTMVNPIVNVEAGGIPMTDSMIFATVGPVNVLGGIIQTINSAAAVTVKGGGSYVFAGTKFQDLSRVPPASVFKILAPPAARIALLQATRTAGSVPWTDRPGAALVVESGGFGSSVALRRTAPVFGRSIVIDAAVGNEFEVTATSAAAFTVAAPRNGVEGQRITITIRNASGGALGAVTWDAVYKLATWTSPASGFSRSIDFTYDGARWREVSRTPADVPD
jgi:hypothetical protein